jgi:hypothetical protein
LKTLVERDGRTQRKEATQALAGLFTTYRHSNSVQCLPYEYLLNVDLREGPIVATEKTEQVYQYIAGYSEPIRPIGKEVNDPSLCQLVGTWGPTISVLYVSGRLALPRQQAASTPRTSPTQPQKQHKSVDSWQSSKLKNRKSKETYVDRMITEQLEAFRKDPSAFPAWAAVAEEKGMEEAESQMCEWFGDSYC